MKLLRCLSLATLFSTSIISTSTLIVNNLKNDQNILNNQSNSPSNTIIDDLSRIIREIKQKIGEIDTKVKKLISERNQLELDKAALDRTATANQAKITELEGQIGQDTEIVQLKKQLEDKEEKLKKLQQEFETASRQITNYKEIVTQAWNEKMKNTVWGGETYKSLLDRLNKTLGFKFELANNGQADNKINDGGDKKFKVKKDSVEIELDMGNVFPKIKSKVEKGNELVEFGWNENGGATPVSVHINKVPPTLPWFINSLQRMFENNQNEHITNLDNWDLTNITNISYMFHKAENFNQHIGHWYTKNVTLMKFTLAGAKKF
ncbi:BspA family leucine-rich repeat surface protein [Mycoplasma cottewii]|uniref:BspA family leucine-rich repeat surface protein n=1 Tax=Mycoplasma cottewii TaxID=51364 RepID=A0ABY5TVN6_9MOLU|nr:BspA family leucine-rich repeat surface protein [Mycoplasma cottewii]UWD34702.1 BspA family leucine-rich repeat surface protein [Mycoplasma cottewii]